MYRKTQTAWPINALFIIAWIFLLITFIYKLGSKPTSLPVFLAISASWLIIVLMFYKFTIQIDDESIHLSFGIGLAKKNIDLNTIESVEQVRNKWWYGLGIRLTPHGWLWNIWGLDAVELTFKEGKRKFRIGTNEPELLKNEIEKRLAA